MPLKERRLLAANVNPAGATPFFDFDDPAIAYVHPIPGGCVVTGLAKGVAKLRAWAVPGQAILGFSPLAEVDIHVRARREFTVDLYYVRDSAGNTSGRNSDQDSQLIATLNRVWRQQANVRFRLRRKLAPANVATNLGDSIFASGDAAEVMNLWNPLRTLATTRNDSSLVNIYLVWNVQILGQPAARPDEKSRVHRRRTGF